MRSAQTDSGLAHRHPDVGMDVVDALDRGRAILRQQDPRARLLGDLLGAVHYRLRWPQRSRAAQSDIHAQLRATDQQRVCRVETAVPDVAEGDLAGGLIGMLQHRQRVRQELRRMDLVGQPVVDRHVGDTRPARRRSPGRSRETRSRRRSD